MNTRCGLAAMLLAVLLACCAPVKPDPEAIAQARTIYAELVTGADEALLARMPNVDNDPGRKILHALHDLVPASKSGPAELVGWRTNVGTAGQETLIFDRYEYPDARIIFQVRFIRANDKEPWRPTGFTLTPVSVNQPREPVVGPEGDPPPQKPSSAPSPG